MPGGARQPKEDAELPFELLTEICIHGMKVGPDGNFRRYKEGDNRTLGPVSCRVSDSFAKMSGTAELNPSSQFSERGDTFFLGGVI